MSNVARLANGFSDPPEAPPGGDDSIQLAKYVLPDALLRSVAAQGGVRRFAAHTIIMSEGDFADYLYIVLTGRVKVFSSNESGKELVIAVHGPGEYVGELALDGGARSASVMTLESSTFALVTNANLRELVASHPDFALSLIHKLIWRVRQATEGMKRLGLEDVYGRIIRVLHDFSDPHGDHRVVRDRMTQRDISERVGSSREMVNRIFKELIAGGYITTEAGRITILRDLPRRW